MTVQLVDIFPDDPSLIFSVRLDSLPDNQIRQQILLLYYGQEKNRENPRVRSCVWLMFSELSPGTLVFVLISSSMQRCREDPCLLNARSGALDAQVDDNQTTDICDLVFRKYWKGCWF